MADTFTCARCGRELPRERMKEVMYEEGEERIREELCPTCLDAAMNESSRARGVAGEKKRAAVHLEGGGGEGERESFGRRE